MTGAIERAVADRRAFAVRFSDLERWDVASFRTVDWKWPADVLRPLGEVLRQKRDPVDKSEGLDDVPIIAKVSFGGEVSVRPPEQRRGYKGRLYWADAGDLIYSKIRVKQGSISVVPEEFDRIAVSSEYPVYEVDQSRLDGQYLELVVRSRPFLNYLDGLAHGGASKTRIPPELFERVLVPVPSLETQRAIVAAWELALAKADGLKQKAAAMERDAEGAFLKALGLRRPRRIERPRAFAVAWSEMERWNVLYNQLAGTGPDLQQGTYPVVTLEELLVSSQYGTSKKANASGRGAPVLRINNIKGGEVDTTDLKHVQLSDSERETYLLERGDILVIRTSGSRDLVGTCAAFDMEGEYAYASYLIRLRVDQDRVAPSFVVYFLNSSLGRRQIDSLSRHIMMNNINSEELRSLELPMPPLHVQSELVAAVGASRKEADELRAEAERRRARARAATEAMILGTRSTSQA